MITNARGIRHWFRPECVLPALLHLLESRPEAHVLVLTLNWPRPQDVQVLLDQLIAHPRAHVADRYLSTEEMRAVWAMTDAFISIPPYDGISEGILEGMYAGGIPVVSDIASNRSFLEEGINAVFVPGPTTEDLLHTLEHVVDTLPELKARMTPTNKAWVENHASVEKTARQVADLQVRPQVRIDALFQFTMVGQHGARNSASNERATQQECTDQDSVHVASGNRDRPPTSAWGRRRPVSRR